MRHHDSGSQFLSVWEYIDDPDARHHIRRAVELILADPQVDDQTSFDSCRSPRHDEEVPVENTNKINSKQ